MDDAAFKSEPAGPQEAQQTPKRPKHKRVNSDDTERPASAQHDRDDSEEHSDVEAERGVSDDEEADPAVQIANFDWDHLHHEYHEAIRQCSQEEAELMEEWTSLMEVLLCQVTCHMSYDTRLTLHSTSVSGQTQDTSTKQTAHSNGKLHVLSVAGCALTKARLQTRTKYVQNEEDELENTRNHCELAVAYRSCSDINDCRHPRGEGF